MNFYDILSEQSCMPHVHGNTRDEVLRSLARHAAALPQMEAVSEEDIYEKLLAREEEGSTGFGHGMAIPHARYAAADGFVLLIATSRKGVDFRAIDKKKVKVFFVLLGPEDAPRDHLKVLAGISSIVSRSNVCRQLEVSVTPSAMYEAFMSKTDEKPEAAREAMKLLNVVLYEDRFFYDIIELFIEEGIDGATILESSGMGQYISNIPLFASFMGFMNEDKNRSRTIMATVPESRVERLIRGIEGITGDLDKKQGAMVMVLDVAFTKGSMKMM
ncbi:MAG: PTS sugar transporter subunit IIA [Kiritimatiellia bacterium]|jgi:mannitol/fructose-specific phosphotransferase system IIA component (Ntr-type)|nr:PTS sugar transporter subunit IIA [Kiritimatiellia bacterium]MDP6630658.1 PTS sugar transporter subunit IIA [Kiritimatiellia bacterium]MDP6809479.1 PTS sugar transporter subunit IIA [Kiritimatiellia bacterium]MDP7023844.1 PTS sugar transporter subunit IIA [Kiritimatiellia bacterium]